eukprot:XP_001200001.2 PREDICTED: ephrin-B2 [Strongylocentrotus purpuratus]
MSHLSRTKFFWPSPMALPKAKSGIIFFVNAVLLLWSVTLAKTLQPIAWDKNNSNFTSTGLNISVEINDLIDIQCPQTENTTEGRLKAQYLKFMQVSYQGYEQCSLSARNRHLLSCNRPYVQNRLTLLFQEHTPYPRGPTFRHGEEYYFITTSNGSANGIDNSRGGLCESHYMKLRVYVKPKPTASPTTGGPPTTPSNSSTPPDISRAATSMTSRTTTRATTTLRTTSLPPTTTRRTTRYTTGGKIKSTEEGNNIPDNMTRGAANRRHVSTTLLLASLLVAVVRWLHP